MKEILRVDNLTKIYPAKKKNKKATKAVKKVSFSLKEGEILGLLGPNGAGKSTIISLLLGTVTPTSGSITVFGKDYNSHRSEIMQQMTFASSYIRLPWRLTILENLRVYGLLYGLSRAVFEKRVKRLLSVFGVWQQRNKIMSELSAGQITRVMITKAFLPYPRIILLDEPTASLDIDIAQQVRQFILEQQKKFKVSMIYTSHNMQEVRQVCNRIIFLRHGKIIAEKKPKQIKSSLEDYYLKLLK